MHSSARTMISAMVMAAMASSAALAGDAKDKPAPAPAAKAAPAAPAGAAKPPAPTPAPAPPPGRMVPPPIKPPPPAPTTTPAMSMEMPKPAPELVEAAKMLKGTWKCSGTVHMPDGASRPSNGTMKFSVDLDKFWIVNTMTEKSKTPYKFTAYITYDGAAKKWNQVMVDSMGFYGVATSDGPKDGAVAWTGTSTGMGMSFKSKMVETTVSPKERKIESQSSKDGGKTWFTDYEGVCKK